MTGSSARPWRRAGTRRHDDVGGAVRLAHAAPQSACTLAGVIPGSPLSTERTNTSTSVHLKVVFLGSTCSGMEPCANACACHAWHARRTANVTHALVSDISQWPRRARSLPAASASPHMRVREFVAGLPISGSGSGSKLQIPVQSGQDITSPRWRLRRRRRSLHLLPLFPCREQRKHYLLDAHRHPHGPVARVQPHHGGRRLHHRLAHALERLRRSDRPGSHHISALAAAIMKAPGRPRTARTCPGPAPLPSPPLALPSAGLGSSLTMRCPSTRRAPDTCSTHDSTTNLRRTRTHTHRSRTAPRSVQGCRGPGALVSTPQVRTPAPGELHTCPGLRALKTAVRTGLTCPWTSAAP